MDGAWGVAVSPDGNYVFVKGTYTDSVAVIDVTVKTAPVGRGGVVNTAYMDGAFGVAVSPDGNYVFVTGANTASVAVVDVTVKNSPVVRGGVKSATYMDTARGDVARRQLRVRDGTKHGLCRCYRRRCQNGLQHAQSRSALFCVNTTCLRFARCTTKASRMNTIKETSEITTSPIGTPCIFRAPACQSRTTETVVFYDSCPVGDPLSAKTCRAPSSAEVAFPRRSLPWHKLFARDGRLPQPHRQNDAGEGKTASNDNWQYEPDVRRLDASASVGSTHANLLNRQNQRVAVLGWHPCVVLESKYRRTTVADQHRVDALQTAGIKEDHKRIDHQRDRQGGAESLDVRVNTNSVSRTLERLQI